ncbi:hypothetical protein Tco_1577002 [Tanacetum coccineum]
MPYSVWNNLSLPELTSTCMTLELADCSITKPIGIAEDVFVNVGKFQFPADFVVVDFAMAHSSSEAITFNLDQTSRYTADYNHMTVNKIDVIDMACDEYSQEVLGFSNVIASGNPTPYFEPIVSTTAPNLTPFGDSDFLLMEEADSFLALEDDPTSSEVDPTYQDPEGDILILEAILNTKTVEPSIDEPPEVELKELPPHLEYAFLEGDNKLPVIIAKDLKDEEKEAFYSRFSVPKRAIAWKLSDIKGVNPEFCIVLGHKISKSGIEVDRAKVEVIAKLPHPTTVKGKTHAVDPIAPKNSDIEIRDIKGFRALQVKLPHGLQDLQNTMPGEIRDMTLCSGQKLLDILKSLLRMPTALSPVVTCGNVKERIRNSAEMPQNSYKFVKIFDNLGIDFMGQFLSSKGTSTYSWPKVHNELNELRDQAYENSLIYKEKTKRIHDAKIKNRVFNVGDRVLLFNSRLKIFSGKLKSRWSGPFTIVQVFPYGTVELSQNSGPNFKVNGHRIKHYFGGDIPTEVVPDLQTFPKDN